MLILGRWCQFYQIARPIFNEVEIETWTIRGNFLGWRKNSARLPRRSPYAIIQNAAYAFAMTALPTPEEEKENNQGGECRGS